MPSWRFREIRIAEHQHGGVADPGISSGRAKGLARSAGLLRPTVLARSAGFLRPRSQDAHTWHKARMQRRIPALTEGERSRRGRPGPDWLVGRARGRGAIN